MHTVHLSSNKSKSRSKRERMMKAMLVCSLLQVLSTQALTHHNHRATFGSRRHTASGLCMFGGDNEIPSSAELETEDPCWQNMLDDDCSMGNIYAANFVAGKWIKSMPCGEGVEASSTMQPA